MIEIIFAGCKLGTSGYLTPIRIIFSLLNTTGFHRLNHTPCELV